MLFPPPMGRSFMDGPLDYKKEGVLLESSVIGKMRMSLAFAVFIYKDQLNIDRYLI